jgi:release factor glutamine methyltransferase
VACAPGVFVPRRRTELLVRLAVDHLSRCAAPRVLDLGCGTGALAAAVLARITGAQVWAVDIDPAAVACARRNLPAGQVLLGDLYTPLEPRLRFAAILANAPYVPTDDIALMPPEARDHEHRVALDGGSDGLDVQRRAIAAAPDRLAPGGVILVETSRRQAPLTAALMRDAGLEPRLHADEEIDGTVVAGTARPAA